jgi:hypothetical protein
VIREQTLQDSEQIRAEGSAFAADRLEGVLGNELLKKGLGEILGIVR